MRAGAAGFDSSKAGSGVRQPWGATCLCAPPILSASRRSRRDNGRGRWGENHIRGRE